MLGNFVLQYILIGVYVVSAYDFRSFEIPQNKGFITSEVEETPPEEENSMLSRDILDVIETLDSQIERTVVEMISNLESENNDSVYDIYNDVGLNKYRRRGLLSIEPAEPLSTQEEIYPKKGFSDQNTSEVNESPYFPSVNEHSDKRSSPQPPSSFKLQNDTETSNESSTLPLNSSPIAGQNVPWALNSSDVKPSVVDITKKIQGPYTEDSKSVTSPVNKLQREEFGKYGLIEDNAQNKKTITILHRMGNNISDPNVANNPTNEETDGSDKWITFTSTFIGVGLIIFAITVVVVFGIIIFVGYITKVVSAYLEMRRENILRRDIAVSSPVYGCYRKGY